MIIYLTLVNIKTKLVDNVASESRWANSVRTMAKSAKANIARRCNVQAISNIERLLSLSRAISTGIACDD
jgi:hypothetical protein